MSLLQTLRARTALAGFATSLLAFGAMALPAAAADAGSASRSYTFSLYTANDVTTFSSCPAGAPYTFICGTGAAALQANNTGDDDQLTGTVNETFFSAIGFPAPTATCAMAMPDYSKVTLTTRDGSTLVMETHDGSYCTASKPLPIDTEPFTIVGGTGKYLGATGQGLVIATPTGQTATQGSAAEIYTATITVPATR